MQDRTHAHPAMEQSLHQKLGNLDGENYVANSQEILREHARETSNKILTGTRTLTGD